MQTLNWTNHSVLFMTVRHIFEISEDDHPRTVSHARDHWWTLDFANAFVSPGVNSREGLVPSHSASRRRLGDYCCSRVPRALPLQTKHSSNACERDSKALKPTAKTVQHYTILDRFRSRTRTSIDDVKMASKWRGISIHWHNMPFSCRL
jgi:hypothetical protein